MTFHIRNWKKYQHRDAIRSGKPMLWIREDTGALSDSDWIDLTFAQRGLLFSMHLEYARSVNKGDETSEPSFRGLPEDPTKLGRRLGQRVRPHDLDALVDAGFIKRRAASVEYASSQRRASVEPVTGKSTDGQPHTPTGKTQETSQILPATGAQISSLEERREEKKNPLAVTSTQDVANSGREQVEHVIPDIASLIDASLKEAHG